MENSMNRRNFLKAAVASGAVLVAGGALAGCAPNGGGKGGSASEGDTVVGTSPVSFTEETDVLILGTGIAGMSAAMDPVEAGHKVMLVDKLDRVGGESFIACGVMNVAGSKMQKDAGIEGDPETKWQAYAPILEKKGETDDMDYKHNVYLYQTEWADRVATDYGAVFQPITDYMDTGAPTSMLLPGNGIGDMQAVLTPLQRALEEKGATYKLNLRARTSSWTARALHRRALQRREEQQARRHQGAEDHRGHGRLLVQPGDGVRLPAQPAAPRAAHRARHGRRPPDAGRWARVHAHGHGGQPHGSADLAQVTVWGLLLATGAGDAAGPPLHQEDQSHDSPDKAAELELGYWWTIFDDQTINGSQKWNVELNMKGSPDRLVGPCGSLDELAAAMDVPAGTLKETFEKYDAMVAAGDTEFGKSCS